jgi:hypothetical protein
VRGVAEKAAHGYLSVSIATIEIVPGAKGTRLVITEADLGVARDGGAGAGG